MQSFPYASSNKLKPSEAVFFSATGSSVHLLLNIKHECNKLKNFKNCYLTYQTVALQATGEGSAVTRKYLIWGTTIKVRSCVHSLAIW